MEEKIEEDVEIAIKEITTDKIKDINFSLNTMSSGNAFFTTEHINGILEGIIIDSQNQTQITVRLGNSDIVVFEIVSFQGNQFIPIRLGVMDCLGESFRDGYTKWALNDRLNFEIKGPMNSEVHFKVRYC